MIRLGGTKLRGATLGNAVLGRTVLGTLLMAALVAVSATPMAGASAVSQAGIEPVGSAAGLGFLHVATDAASPNGLAGIVDESGRDVLLRGVNITGLQDDRVDDGALETGISYPAGPADYTTGCPADDPRVEAVVFCKLDADQLRDEGYDVVRLALNWSLLEPQPGQLSQAYLDRIDQVVGWLSADGIRSILDMHSDGWSRYLEAPAGTACPPESVPGHGQDGAPAWATDNTTVPSCQAVDASLNPAIEYNTQRLYSNIPAGDRVGLQTHYISLFTALATRFGANPGVAGYEVQNEPLPGLAPGVAFPAELLRLDAAVVSAMQAATPSFRQLVFIEPEAERNATGAPQAAAPWSAYSAYPNVVYAPHVYTGVFTQDGISFDQDYSDAVGDAKVVGLPLLVGEFGGPPASDPDLTNQHYAHQDADLIGSTMWDWKDNHTGGGGWSVYLPPFGGTATGTPNTQRKLLGARAYPEAVAGTLLSLAETPSTPGGFAMTATSAAVHDLAHATVVELPSTFPGAPIVTGAGFTVTPRGSGREVVLTPTGGSYSLRLGAAGGQPSVAPPAANSPATTTTTAAASVPVAGTTPARGSASGKRATGKGATGKGATGRGATGKGATGMGATGTGSGPTSTGSGPVRSLASTGLPGRLTRMGLGLTLTGLGLLAVAGLLQRRRRHRRD